MKRNLGKTIRRDCIRIMYPAFFLLLLRKSLMLVLPVITARLLGDMTDALLHLNFPAIQPKLAGFAVTVLLDTLSRPLLLFTENVALVKRGYRYSDSLYYRYLRSSMKTAGTIDAATLVERSNGDTTEYYYTLMEQCTIPISLFLGALSLLLGFKEQQLPLPFVLTMLVLATVPLIRAVAVKHQKARLKKETLTYQEQRKELEYGMFAARGFLFGFRLENEYISHLHKRFSDFEEKTGTAQDRMDGTDAMFGYLCTYGLPVVVIGIGSAMIAGGQMSLGALLAGYLMLPTLTRCYENLETLILNVPKLKISQERMEIFYGTEDSDSGASCAAKALCLENVTFTYPTAQKPVFCDKNLTLPLDGSRIRLTAPNGGGKSTLLGLIAGIYAPDSGFIRDEAGNRPDQGALRRLVSLQEQDGAVFSATVFENLFLPEEKRQEATELLTAFGFTKPLDRKLAEGGSDLSPGERKKLLLTRALLKPSAVLALDEPFNHLDAQGRAVLLERLNADPRTVLLVSHEPVAGCAWERLEL